MALNDTISTIEAELETLKESIAPAAVVEPTPAVVQAEPEVIVPETPEPQVHQAPASPILQMAIDQAAERLARETAE